MGAELDDFNTYHDPNKLVRLSNWSGYLSWVILIMVVILTLFRMISEFPYYLEQIPQLWDTVPMIISPFYTLAVGLFYFVVLQTISEGINIWMDIYENTQKDQPEGSNDL